MSDRKHSPLPWRLQNEDEYGADIVAEDGRYVAVDHEGILPCVRNRADADLIVAAVNARADIATRLIESATPPSQLSGLRWVELETALRIVGAVA